MGRLLRTLGVCVAVVVTLALSAPDSLLLAQTTATQTDPPPPPPGVSAALDSARALRGQRMAITLYTYGPGNAVFERFGHIALAVHDSASGQNIAFNWGMFDFNQPNFLSRFLTGDTNYWMAGFNTDAFNAMYRSENRSIRAQQLVLTPVERAALFEFAAWNATESHKFYRYDYYEDNCATRIRDALDYVLRGQLRSALTAPGAGHTWRGETARITASDLPTYAGIEIALGRNADMTLTKWQEAFLPEYLAGHLAGFIVRDGESRRYSLVGSDTVLFAAAERVPLPTEPPGRLAAAALIGLTLAGLIAALADAKQRVARALLSIAVALGYIVGGILGTLLMLAGTVTKHAPYMGSNTTLLQLHVLLLVAAWPVSRALWHGTRSRVAFGLSAVVALLSLTGVVLQFVPSLTQSSGVVLAVMVPVHIALALAMWRLDHHDAAHRRASVPIARAA